VELSGPLFQKSAHALGAVDRGLEEEIEIALQAEALIEGGLSAAEGWETEAAARLVELALRGDGYAVAA